MPEFLNKIGLDAYEIQCGRGVRMKDDAAKQIGESAKKNGISLSVHAPYYISMSSMEEEEKRLEGKQFNASVAVDYIARGLSEILDVEPEFVREQAADTAYYYKVIKRKVPEDTAQKVRQFINDNELTGLINLEMDSQRYYPYGSLAGQLMGFVRTDNVGAEGLEAYYDAALTGNAGAVITTKGNHGSEMLYTYEKYYDPSDGNSLVLTLDVTA